MDVRSLGYRTDIALLVASGSTVEDRGTHLVVRTPDNPTYFWGNFILLAEAPVPGGEREVVGAFRAEFPEAEHVSIGVDAELDGAARARFTDAGLSVDDDVELSAADLIQPLAPLAAVEYRPLVSEEDWAAWAIFEMALTPEAPEAEHAAYVQGRVSAERALVAAGAGERFGGFVDGQLVTTAGIFRTEASLARFQSVATRPDMRRQGLAAGVVHAAGRHAFDELGVERLVIVATDGGPATEIYRRLGFVDSGRMVGMEARPAGWANA